MYYLFHYYSFLIDCSCAWFICVTYFHYFQVYGWLGVEAFLPDKPGAKLCDLCVTENLQLIEHIKNPKNVKQNIGHCTYTC